MIVCCYVQHISSFISSLCQVQLVSMKNASSVRPSFGISRDINGPYSSLPGPPCSQVYL